MVEILLFLHFELGVDGLQLVDLPLLHPSPVLHTRLYQSHLLVPPPTPLNNITGLLPPLILIPHGLIPLEEILLEHPAILILQIEPTVLRPTTLIAPLNIIPLLIDLEQVLVDGLLELRVPTHVDGAIQDLVL